MEATLETFEPLVDPAGELVDLRPEGVEPGVCRSGLHGALHCCIVNISMSSGVVFADWIVR
jgi:hypothetical protein